MAGRDRLNTNRYNSDNAPSYSAGGGYNPRANPFAHSDEGGDTYGEQQGGRYEMNQVSNNNDNKYAQQGGGGGGGDQSFYNDIDSISESIAAYEAKVRDISDAHNRSLAAVGQQDDEKQMNRLMDEASGMSRQIRDSIKGLERKGGSGGMRRQQIGVIKEKFKKAIQEYQTVETRYRQRTKDRLTRQYKLVKPDASDQEVQEYVNDDQGGGVFQQALMSSNKEQHRAAYREVQKRHQDIQRIEQTLTELAQLFNDMSILVEQQDETLTAIEANATNVEKDTEQGLQYTETAVVSARAARKKRWICFFIILVILIIIAIILAIQIPKLTSNTNKN